MESMKSLVKRFVKEEEGVSLLEYGLLAALIAVVCILVVKATGTKVASTFDNVQSQMTTNGVDATVPTPAK
jgi:pilus assembly protein Flp/PilA